MSNIVSYNTEQMREWSNKITNNNDSYFDNITKLFQEIESFVGSGFTGGLADEFLESFQDKKKYFIDNKDIIDECTELITKRANKIDSDEEELMNQIKNDTYFND